MPIYEYRCTQCGHKFDKLVKLSAQTADIECPRCGAHQAEKAVSRVAATSTGSLSGPSLGTSCGPVG